MSWGIVAHGLGHVLATVAKTQSNPPAYYVLLWLWSRVSGLGAAGLRSLSAVCGLLTIWVVGVVGRRLVSERVGLAAAVLTAVNPIMVWYSQEARAYAMVILLSALSLLVLLRALERPNGRRLLVWGVCAAAAIGVHYFAVFVIAPEAAWLVVSLRRQRRLTLGGLGLCLGPVLLVGAGLLPLLIHQADGRAAFIATNDGSLPRRAVRLVKEDILGFSEPSKAAFSAVAGLLLLAVGGLLIHHASRGERRRLALPLTVGAGGVLLALAAAMAGADYINTRNLLPTWPALALVIAGGVGARAAGRAGMLALSGFAALSLACVAAVVLTPLYQRADWRDVAHTLGAPAVTRAIVGDRLAYTSLAPYVARLSQASATKVRVAEVDMFALALQSSPPPRAPTPPVLPGFRVIQRVNTDTYTFLRYRAPTPVTEPLATLLALGLLHGGSANAVLLQSP